MLDCVLCAQVCRFHSLRYHPVHSLGRVTQIGVPAKAISLRSQSHHDLSCPWHRPVFLFGHYMLGEENTRKAKTCGGPILAAGSQFLDKRHRIKIPSDQFQNWPGKRDIKAVWRKQRQTSGNSGENRRGKTQTWRSPWRQGPRKSWRAPRQNQKSHRG